jgi:hypothetical protein
MAGGAVEAGVRTASCGRFHRHCRHRHHRRGRRPNCRRRGLRHRRLRHCLRSSHPGRCRRHPDRRHGCRSQRLRRPKPFRGECGSAPSYRWHRGQPGTSPIRWSWCASDPPWWPRHRRPSCVCDSRRSGHWPLPTRRDRGQVQASWPRWHRALWPSHGSGSMSASTSDPPASDTASPRARPGSVPSMARRTACDVSDWLRAAVANVKAAMPASNDDEYSTKSLSSFASSCLNACVYADDNSSVLLFFGSLLRLTRP